MGLRHVVSEISGTGFSLPYLVARGEGYCVEEGTDIGFVKHGVGATTGTRSVQLVDDHHLVSSFEPDSGYEKLADNPVTVLAG